MGSYAPANREEWRRWGYRALLFLALTAFTWPVRDLITGPGTDASWQIGLTLAISEGLAWGRDVAFTYGPLGFSVYPVAVTSGTVLPALFLNGAVHLAFVGVLYVSLRRQYGPIASILLTFLAASAVGAVQSDATLIVGFGIAALAATAPVLRARHVAWALAVAGGALAGFTLLVKLNDGVAIALIVAVVLAASPSPKRALALGLGSGTVTLVVLWLLAGQPLPDLPDYARNGIETIGGYVEAMGLEEAGEAGEWQLLVIVGSAVTVSALAWTSFPELSRRRLGSLVAAVLLVHYFVLREVMVRHDLARGAYLVLLVPVVLMIPWPRPRRSLSLAIAAALTVAFLASFPYSPEDIWDPDGRASAMVEQLEAGLDDSKLDEMIAAGQGAVDAIDSIPPQVQAALRGHCVSAEPNEIAFVWRYGFEWCPLPALQSYTAYTSRLDQLDADRYDDPVDGPERVLRTDFAIDGRRPAWESPAAMLSLLCNYTETARGGAWQALARVPDRCGDPLPVATVEGRLGEPIELPPAPPGTVLVAHVDGLQITPLERLEMLFGRPTVRTVSIGGGTPYRVLPDTAGDGLIVSVPAAVDYAAPFSLGSPDATSLTAAIGSDQGDVSVELTALPIG